MIKIGDRLLLKQSGTFATVSKIVNEEGDGTETNVEAKIAATRLVLDSEFGSCKVYLHDQERSWIAYSNLN